MSDREALIRELLDVPDNEHFDRVARINAPLVLANGGALYQSDGYRNGELLTGCNIVRAYLEDLARDYGVDIRRKR